jgi:hypothetical protein
MTNARDLLADLDWRALAQPIARAEDALARLDERLAKSPIREGWIARTHFLDAAAALWLEGELVQIEDLVLHDAGMDVRTPTHELTRAHAILRTRRRIASAEPGWALSDAGLAALRGRAGEGVGEDVSEAADAATYDEEEDSALLAGGDEEEYADLYASVDAAIAFADKTLAGETPTPEPLPAERDPLVYDLDWDEDARLAEWSAIVAETRELPPTLAAALAAEAWNAIEPLQHALGLGRLLAAALLRARGKTDVHLACLAKGARAAPRERRRAHDAATRLIAQLDGMTATAKLGLELHDRWLLARLVLLRKLDSRRSTSRLPDLIDYVQRRPIVSAGMIARELGVTPRAAQNLVAELGLREATGRGRYRAWGIL